MNTEDALKECEACSQKWKKGCDFGLIEGTKKSEVTPPSCLLELLSTKQIKQNITTSKTESDKALATKSNKKQQIQEKESKRPLKTSLEQVPERPPNEFLNLEDLHEFEAYRNEQYYK